MGIDIQSGDVELIKQQKSRSEQHPMNLQDKSLLIDLDGRDWERLVSISAYIGVQPSLLARALIKQAMLRFSHRERLDELSLMSTSPVPATALLRPREMEILKLMAQGISNKAIACIFNIKEQTVKNYVTSILRKLEANNRTHAVSLALTHNLIEPQPMEAGRVPSMSS